MLDELRKLEEEIRNCTRCPLHKLKTNYVPGDGNPTSGIVFIGEAPGREEDKQGKPFVGAAGKLLNRMIEEILGLKREDVYITNVLKCRPPNNRDPTEEEIRACSPWLEKQLEIIKPDIIVTLGRFSTKRAFDYFGLKFTRISKVRGKIYEVSRWGKIVRLIPTYHPAAVLYHAQWKRAFEEDFRKIRDILSGKQKKKTILDYFK